MLFFSSVFKREVDAVLRADHDIHVHTYFMIHFIFPLRVMQSLTALTCKPARQALTASVYIVLGDLDLWSV
jgi:uncharacterized membrane protein YwaF